MLDQVQQVLDEYSEHLPLTVRQIYYRLVGAHAYPKTQRDYENLCEHIVRARRARIIEMGDIRDDGITRVDGPGYRDISEFFAQLRSDASTFQLDRSSGQSTRLVVLCEAAGMVPQLAKGCSRFDVSVISCGGFDSLTAKFELVTNVRDEGRPIEYLHIGDHDPSGEHMFEALKEDVAAFVDELGGEVSFTRLAVTTEQIARYRLPTAPRKPSDRRSFRGQTCQAEALAPDVLGNIVRRAIEARIDKSQLDRVLRQEKAGRKRLLKQLKEIVP